MFILCTNNLVARSFQFDVGRVRVRVRVQL